MQLLGIEWEKVSTKRNTRRNDQGSYVYLQKSGVKKSYARIDMSPTLVDETGWKSEDRVTLYKQGTKLFLLKREPVGLLAVRGKGKRLYINSVDACRNLYPSQNGNKFEATYDKDIDAVILMPARQ